MSTNSADNNNSQTSRPTHVMFVDNVEDFKGDFLKPLFYTSLKDASDEADKIIKENPLAKCGIYQLRVDLKGEVNVIREDFSN